MGIGRVCKGKYSPYENGVLTRTGRLWYGVMTRVGNKIYQKRFPCYKGCTVSRRWRNFQHFSVDILKVKGADLWLAGEKVHLDKDLNGNGGKHYSLETCEFLSASHNCRLAGLTGQVYKASHKDFKDVTFTDQGQFCKDYALNRGNVSSTISGRYKSTKGWTILIVKEERNFELC